jgi:tripeptide aminopeptidase
MRLMAIPGPSGKEGQVVAFIEEQLRRAGAPADAIRTDNAHRRTPLAGETGNLVLKLPGRCRGPRRLLMAHLDTVPICVGSRPVRKGDRVRSADPKTGLGADDRAGAAAVLNTAIELLSCDVPYPPVTFFWPVQEEVGLQGARHAQLGLLGRPKLAFNFDGGSPEKLTVGATGGYRMTIHVEGVPSHAGGAPEQGVSAVAIASLAIADLHRNGWHGAIRKNRRRGTSNFGVIRGGTATNVVTEHVEIKAEARSHDAVFRRQIVERIQRAFEKAAASVTNVLGAAGTVTFDGRLDYESFRLAGDEPCVTMAEKAIRADGGQPMHFVSDGGLDANWLTARGVPTVTLGCGQLFQHTRKEQLDVPAFQQACRIALRLATNQL